MDEDKDFLKQFVDIHLFPYLESNGCSFPLLDNPNITVQKTLPISTLKDYISLKLNIPQNFIDIIFNHQILDSKQTIEDFQLSYNYFKNKIIFNYRFIY